MKKFISRLPKILLFCIPYFFGLAGFLSAKEAPLDAMFEAMLLYMLQISDPAPNTLVEIARWTAPLATASGILLLLASFWNDLRNFICYHRGNSVAVYGPEAERLDMLKKLGKHGIDGGDSDSSGSAVRAHRYILLGSEEENLRFYAKNRGHLEQRPVYLQCSSLPVQSASEPNLRLFCPEETAARQYWKERSLLELSFQQNHLLKVVFLGFGRLGEELLTFALQDNIFHPKQKIEYHILDSEGDFFAVHPQLPAISDPVFFHEEPWHSALSLLEAADRVIVLTQDDQLSLLRKLLSVTTRQEIDVFSTDIGIELLAGRGRLKPYPWQEWARQPEQIFSDKLYDRAKRLNLRYAVLYSGAAETDEAKEAEWQKLDTFTRYSNISAADYHEIQLQMLQRLGKTPEECMELLAELEHIRWCRYHFLNNWRYGIPENGKSKDPARRIHKDLVPYDTLTESEKQKDRDSINVLLSVK